jgi:hypothetical protein
MSSQIAELQGKQAPLTNAQLMQKIENGNINPSELSKPIWYNPEDQTLYEGSSYVRPTYNNPILNVAEFMRINALRRQGKGRSLNDMRAGQTAGLYDEHYADFDETLAVMEKQFRGDKDALHNAATAGVLTRSSYLQYKTVVASTDIIFARPPDHVLRSAVNNIQTAQTIYAQWLQDAPFDPVQEYIDELEIPDTGETAFTKQEQRLDLYGAHIATTWEFRNETYDINIYQRTLESYSGAMERRRNQRVADQLNAVSGTAQNLWDATSGSPPTSTNDPVPNIETLVEAIYANNKGGANTIVSNRKAFRSFIGNTWNTGYGTYTMQSVPATTTPQPNFTETNVHPRLPGFRWIVDSLITNGTYIVLDPQAFTFYNGPERNVTYRSDINEIEGTVYRAYFACRLIDGDRVRRGTGVTS